MSITDKTDKTDKQIVLQDYEARGVVGVQIGTLGHKLWVCIDGVAVLRVRSPEIEVEDMRILEVDENDQT